MNRYGKRCVLYPRVSTEMQVDGYSLEGQKNMLTRFADREEMIVVDTYEDAGKSGKSIEGRPAFQKMLRDIEDGLDIDYILVYKLSRFGRNAADILNSLELVQSYGVNLICIEEGIDSSQTSGKLLISVLSAVAEIERENIIEQTMNGRREKARQGGWNGGFAPYGYTLEDNKLMIEETEAVAIRKIFELYTSSEIGLGGIANQLNLQGIRKIPRQNGTLEDWTGHFIKLILDNPVYCGKIAYGRRTKEKVKGTKNDYQMKRNDDYILTEGQHKGIVSEEVWEKAHAKRLRTGVKQPSKIGRDRVHLLSGLLKCPVCGSPMYTNKHAWTNKDGTYKEIYYYVCSRNRMVRGKHCEYKAMLKKTDIEPMVIEAIREIVRNEEYAQAIKKRIGVQIDTKAVDKELEGYQAKLKEVDLNKTRLEREIDSLPADAKYRERKLHDMTLRLDSLYDVIVELEEKIEDARLRRDAIKQQAITLENIYKIMVNFDCVYNIINDEEKRNVVTALIKEIEIYRNDESEYPLKRIGLNFPVFKDGGEVTELLWDKGNTVETVCDAYYTDTIVLQKCFQRLLLGDLILALHGNRDNMSMRDRRMYQNTSCFDMRHNRHKIKCLMRRRLVDFQCVGQSAMIITRVSYTANDGDRNPLYTAAVTIQTIHGTNQASRIARSQLEELLSQSLFIVCTTVEEYICYIVLLAALKNTRFSHFFKQLLIFCAHTSRSCIQQNITLLCKVLQGTAYRNTGFCICIRILGIGHIQIIRHSLFLERTHTKIRGTVRNTNQFHIPHLTYTVCQTLSDCAISNNAHFYLFHQFTLLYIHDYKNDIADSKYSRLVVRAGNRTAYLHRIQRPHGLPACSLRLHAA